MSENRRQCLFLSHKTVDRPMVDEFEKILSQLGFEVWIDTKRMPAGSVPHRAILAGVQAACAAIFFITPAFRDEKWLAEEIDYAVAEKRNRGDRFEIITLVFRDDRDRRPVEIPDMLRRFIYKEPKNWLEALREIIVALPVRVGPVGWVDETLAISQQQTIHEVLDQSGGDSYTNAKQLIATWARQRPAAFQADQILPNGTFGAALMVAWDDYERPTVNGLHDARGLFNKYWDRLVQRFESEKIPYDAVFKLLGDNLWLMSVTQPLEILLAKKLGTRGKPNLSLLLARFQEWLRSDSSLEVEYRAHGFRVTSDATIWTQCWPWPCNGSRRRLV